MFKRKNDNQRLESQRGKCNTTTFLLFQGDLLYSIYVDYTAYKICYGNFLYTLLCYILNK